MFPVDTFQKTLAKIEAILVRHEVRFHLTGGLTGTAYGEPRMTQDIDLVIDPDQTARVVDHLVESLAESDFMFDERALRQAVKEGGMFQLLDQREVLKLDIYPRELIEGELSRSEQLEIFFEAGHAVTIGNIPGLEWFQAIPNGKSRLNQRTQPCISNSYLF